MNSLSSDSSILPLARESSSPPILVPSSQVTPQQNLAHPPTELGSNSMESTGISKALNDMTNVLSELVKRVENNSHEIKTLKLTVLKKVSTSISPESSTKKREVSTIVRVSDPYIH